MKALLFIIALIYCASPVDMFPGPIDVAIVCVVAAVIIGFLGGPNNRNQNGNGPMNNGY